MTLSKLRALSDAATPGQMSLEPPEPGFTAGINAGTAAVVLCGLENEGTISEVDAAFLAASANFTRAMLTVLPMVEEALEAGLAATEHCRLNATYHKRVLTEALTRLRAILEEQP